MRPSVLNITLFAFLLLAIYIASIKVENKKLKGELALMLEEGEE